MPLLILLYPFIEIYLLYKFAQTFSFGDLILFILTTGIAGFAIMSMMGKDIFLQFQTSVARKEVPAEKLIHKAAMLLGGLLIFLPGIISDLVGVILVLPGFRHLAVWYIKFTLARAIAKGTARVFVSNMSWNFGGPGPFTSPDSHEERDAKVIDITAIESKRSIKSDENT